MRPFSAIIGLLSVASMDCASAQKSDENPPRAAPQPADGGAGQAVSLKANVTRENGLTRIDFAWAGLKEPGILVVNIDEQDPSFHDPPGGGGTLFGITLVRQVQGTGSTTLVFDHPRMAQAIQDMAFMTAYVTDSVRLSIREDVGVKSMRSVRTVEFGANDCAAAFVLVPSSADTSAHLAFSSPPVTRMNLEMPPRGGAIAGVYNLRARVQVPIDLRLREGSADH